MITPYTEKPNIAYYLPSNYYWGGQNFSLMWINHWAFLSRLCPMYNGFQLLLLLHFLQGKGAKRDNKDPEYFNCLNKFNARRKFKGGMLAIQAIQSGFSQSQKNDTKTKKKWPHTEVLDLQAALDSSSVFATTKFVWTTFNISEAHN